MTIRSDRKNQTRRSARTSIKLQHQIWLCKMAKIFISYSRGSQDIVEELVQDLHDDGHEAWFDQRLTGGQQWWDKILSEIRTCDIFVAALTPDSLESLACQRELTYADLLQKSLCPVRLDDKVRPEALAHRLAELKWVDYCHRDKLAFKNLQRTIRGLPKAPPLPDSLPDPPAVPRSYLSTMRERIETDSPLEYKDQAQLVFELRRHFRDGGAAEEITDLLQRLKKRDELFAKAWRDIDELLGDISRGKRGSLSSNERTVSTDTPMEARKAQVQGAGPDNHGATAARTVNRELVMAVAAELGSMARTWYTPDIPAKMAINARASTKMPADESMLVLFDATAFGSAKVCLLIGVTGLYYKSRHTSPEYASWEEFLANPIEKGLWAGLNVAGRGWYVSSWVQEPVLTFLMRLRARALDGL